MSLQLIPSGHLFLTPAYLSAKNQARLEEVYLVFDTGAAMTILDPSITDCLGYSAQKDGIGKSTLDGAGGKSVGYVIQIPSFQCLGFELKNFEIACHDMNTRLGVSGILGMNFLSHFRFNINFKTGEIFQIERL